MTEIISLLLWFALVTLAVWQTVEILHHSKFGEVWRGIASWLSHDNGGVSDDITMRIRAIHDYIGQGMSCPFCYSNWFGFLYFGAYAFYVYNPFIAAVLTFIGGLAAARAANVLNDITYGLCRTPDTNPNSESGKKAQLFEEEMPQASS